MPNSRLLLNLAHLIDHWMMLIFPTAVLAIGREWGVPFSELLPLALPGFIAFGAGSLPAGWLADRWSRFGTMALFFFGIGAAAIMTGFAETRWQLAAGLTIIGVFAAIYHPVGIAMLVAATKSVGKTLGVNGVYGNLGLAFAALATGFIADRLGWRAAFWIPGVISVVLGLLFLRAGVPHAEGGGGGAGKHALSVSRDDLVRVFAVVMASTICGGIIFNATTVTLPKLFEERIFQGTATTTSVGALVALVFCFAAIAQLVVGHLIDRFGLRRLFLAIVAAQVPLLALATQLSGAWMVLLALPMMFFVFGQIPLNDAMVTRYIRDEWRSRALAVRYVVSFGASALAVPLIAYFHARYGGFSQFFVLLASLAFVALMVGFVFPSHSVRHAQAD